jgi:Phospholipase_D-nuclease N-terminal
MSIKAAVIFIALCVPFLLATIWAIVDVAQKDFGTIGKKALWWVISSIPFIGFFIYLLFGFRKGKKTGLIF